MQSLTSRINNGETIRGAATGEKNGKKNSGKEKKNPKITRPGERGKRKKEKNKIKRTVIIKISVARAQ